MSQFQGNPQIQAAMVSQLMQGLNQRRGDTLSRQGELHTTRMNQARMDASSMLSEGFVSQFGPTAGSAMSQVPNAEALRFMAPGSEFFERRQQVESQHREKMRELKRESGKIAAQIAKETGGIRGFDQTFQRTLSSYANEMANDRVHNNARAAVTRALQENQNRFIQLGAGGTFGIGGAGVGDDRLGMSFDTTYQERIGMGMTPYAAAKAALETSRATPAVDGQGFFGDAPGFFDDAMDAAEPVGETLGLGGSLLATAAGVGGLILLSNPVGLFVAGLAAVTGVTGLVGQGGDQSEAEVKENVQQALAEYKTDYEGLEAANLITASRSLSRLGKGGEKASEGLFLGLQKLFRGVEGSGGDPQQMIDSLAQLKAEYGVSLEQLHAAAEAVMESSRATATTALQTRQEFETILATEEDASNTETQRLMVEKSDDVRQAHQKLQFKAQAAMAFLEDMGKQTTDTTARFFTAEERADAASELLLGSLETAFDDQGNINPEFEEVFAKIEPRMAQALSDLISNRLGALDRLEGLEGQQMDVAELLDPEMSPLITDLERDLAAIEQENFQANQAAAEQQMRDQQEAAMLLDEISAGLRFLEQ